MSSTPNVPPTPPSLRRFARLTLVSVLVLIALICYFSIQSLLRQRLLANEQNAVTAIRAINTELFKFRNEHPDAGYPSGLAELRGRIDETLTCAVEPCLRNGYRFTYTLLPATNMGPHYKVEARPNKYGNTGEQSFYSDESGRVRATREDRSARASDAPVL